MFAYQTNQKHSNSISPSSLLFLNEKKPSPQIKTAAEDDETPLPFDGIKRASDSPKLAHAQQKWEQKHQPREPEQLQQRQQPQQQQQQQRQQQRQQQQQQQQQHWRFEAKRSLCETGGDGVNATTTTTTTTSVHGSGTTRGSTYSSATHSSQSSCSDAVTSTCGHGLTGKKPKRKTCASTNSTSTATSRICSITSNSSTSTTSNSLFSTNNSTSGSSSLDALTATRRRSSSRPKKSPQQEQKHEPEQRRRQRLVVPAQSGDADATNTSSSRIQQLSSLKRLNHPPKSPKTPKTPNTTSSRTSLSSSWNSNMHHQKFSLINGGSTLRSSPSQPAARLRPPEFPAIQRPLERRVSNPTMTEFQARQVYQGGTPVAMTTVPRIMRKPQEPTTTRRRTNKPSSGGTTGAPPPSPSSTRADRQGGGRRRSRSRSSRRVSDGDGSINTAYGDDPSRSRTSRRVSDGDGSMNAGYGQRSRSRSRIPKTLRVLVNSNRGKTAFPECPEQYWQQQQQRQQPPEQQQETGAGSTLLLEPRSLLDDRRYDDEEGPADIFSLYTWSQPPGETSKTDHCYSRNSEEDEKDAIDLARQTMHQSLQNNPLHKVVMTFIEAGTT